MGRNRIPTAARSAIEMGVSGFSICADALRLSCHRLKRQETAKSQQVSKPAREWLSSGKVSRSTKLHDWTGRTCETLRSLAVARGRLQSLGTHVRHQIPIVLVVVGEICYERVAARTLERGVVGARPLHHLGERRG